MLDIAANDERLQPTRLVSHGSVSRVALLVEEPMSASAAGESLLRRVFNAPEGPLSLEQQLL
jgi:hypothetical protein